MRTSALIIVLLLLVSPVSLADEGDLKQTIDDLTAQTADKQRLDEHGATQVEISHIQTWISDATNAVKEDEPKKCRRAFNRIREQLKLVDELIKLSKLEASATGLEELIARITRANETNKSQLLDKEAKLRALKMQKK